MKKQLVIIGIITLLFTVGLSGCNEDNNTSDETQNTEFIDYVNETKDILSRDMVEYTKYASIPISWQFLKAKATTIYDKLNQIIFAIDAYDVPSGNLSLIKQEYKLYLTDLKEQMFYTQKACFENESENIGMELYYLDIVIGYMNTSSNHLIRINNYLSGKNNEPEVAKTIKEKFIGTWHGYSEYQGDIYYYQEIIFYSSGVVYWLNSSQYTYRVESGQIYIDYGSSIGEDRYGYAFSNNDNTLTLILLNPYNQGDIEYTIHLNKQLEMKL
jgi:hypothetical protein